ncbi:MAG: FABP family protein [Actinomycetota bacterium]|nr:FABP family protein [Actinomycetota bacterium]
MPFEIPADLHTDLVPLAWLLGSWHGNGRGDYPTIEAFTYEQDVVFAHDTRPFLHYFSRAWITDEEGNRVRPGALETGFVRPTATESDEGTGIELVLAHATGFAEVWYGTIDGPRLTMSTDIVARTQTAKEYTAGQRMYGLVDGDLMYAFDMAAEGQPLQSHLWGQLKRV